MRETRFLGWSIALAVRLLVVILPVLLIEIAVIPRMWGASFETSYLVILISSFFYLPIAYVFSRWAMVLPATAIDQTHKSIGWSWHMTKGHSLQLFILIGIIPFTTDILLSLLPFGTSIVGQLCYEVIWLIVGAIEICLLSLSFGMLNEWASGDTKNTEEQTQA